MPTTAPNSGIRGNHRRGVVELPPLDLVLTDAPGETAYRAALRAGDESTGARA